MVFILIGAVKAAKHARNEYNKDKKRNTVISPVDGSHDMMADRGQAASSQSHQSGATDWWGTCRGADGQAPTCDASHNPNLVGAWSRDQPVQQPDDDSTARPTSGYASSASASTELSAPIGHSPHERSASLSRLDTVKPRSRGSGEVEILTRPASMDTPPSHDHSEGQLPVRRTSTGLETIEEASERNSFETSEIPRRANTQREAPAGNVVPPPKRSDAVAPVRSLEEVERKAERQREREKASVQGSFAEAMRKPMGSKPIASNSTFQPSGETVSALARNASKGLRRKSTQEGSKVQGTSGHVSEDGDGTQSALSQSTFRDHTKRFGRRSNGLSNVPGKDSSAGSTPMPEMAPQSALARNASKGPRRRFEPLANESTKVVAAEIGVTGSYEQKGKQENTRFVDRQPQEARTGVSAFAGAPTKKRSKRVPPANQARGEDLNFAPESTATSQLSELPPKPRRSSAPVAGSSMYAAGTMKKRTSGR